MVWNVELSNIVQTGVDMIKTLNIPELSQEVCNLIKDKTKFTSCQQLIDFLIPLRHHPRFLSENVQDLLQLSEILSGIHTSRQVNNYLKDIWQKPSVKNEYLRYKERCHNTDWVLRIACFASLLNLKLDATQYCQKLEYKLMAETPEWLANWCPPDEIPGALLVEYHKEKLTVECIANRFIEAFKWLQIEEADPMKSFISFTKFVETLSFRNQPNILPDEAMMLFWLEIFVSLAMFLLAKSSTAETHFVLPATYLDAVRFADLILRIQSRPIQELVHLCSNHKVDLLLDNFQSIVGLVCGYQSPMGLLKLFFVQNKGDFLAAERCLVLAMTVLVNVGSLLPVIYEDYIVKSIATLKLSESGPRRLHKILEAVARSNSAHDIAAILQHHLKNREDEQLLDCWWSWNSDEKQGVQFCQFTDFSRLPHKWFSTFKLGQQTRAANTIQRFFKNIIMKHNITNLARRALYQEMLEVFAPFAIKETFCGVCGVPLITSETKENASSSEDQRDATAWNTANLCLPRTSEGLTPWRRRSDTLETHLASEKHIEKNAQFERFKKLYYADNMRKLLHELSYFVGFHKLRSPDMKADCYADISLDIDRLLSEMDTVKSILQSMMENHSWKKIKELRHALFTLYQDYLFGRAVIARKFHEYKEEQRMKPHEKSGSFRSKQSNSKQNKLRRQFGLPPRLHRQLNMN
ncbi:TPR and ankyrin repeat-containing protein 1-like [Gigantopelta aegis]|uniref:TPR and ankyrin repeat-containing protein 1-like n=1 Tax=Gigantopelta aegis TaxID=1735272 RepID=UPI001B888771|nr:TPR and ankyrin repeat-containing protein 1-like [Gigantopelta aegis]